MKNIPNLSTIELPALTGSDKQIVWAETLRREMLEGAISAQTVRETRNGELDPASPRYEKSLEARITQREQLSDAVEILTRIERADFWIDAREVDAQTVVDHIARKRAGKQVGNSGVWAIVLADYLN